MQTLLKRQKTTDKLFQEFIENENLLDLQKQKNEKYNNLDDLWGGPGKFDLDGLGLNGVALPSKMHLGAHSKVGYYDKVYKKLIKANSKESAIFKIKEIRTELLTGRGREFKLNKNWDAVGDTYFNDMAKTAEFYD